MTGDRVAEIREQVEGLTGWVPLKADGVRDLLGELDRVKRGGKTLGELVDRQCMDVLNATGLHHMVDETGDGDWQAIWERLAELRPERDKALAEVARLRAQLDTVRELHQPRTEHVITGNCAAEACDHEDIEDCPTIPFEICAGCHELAELANSYFAENSVGIVAYPCETARAALNQGGETK